MKRLFTSLICCVIAVALLSAQDTLRVQKRRALPRTSLAMGYERGSVGDYDRFRAALTVPFFRARYLTLSGSCRYTFVDQDLDDKTEMNDASAIGLSGSHHLIVAGVGAYSRIKIGDSSVNLFGHLMADFSRWGYENATGILAGVLMLKESRYDAFGIGVVGLIHSASDWPIFPMITWRKQLNRRTVLDVTLPNVKVHYYANEAMKCSAGMDIDYDRIYFRPHRDELPRTCRYSHTMMKFGGEWEWKPASSITLRMAAGTKIKLKSEVATTDGRHDYFDVSQPMSLYFNVGTILSL